MRLFKTLLLLAVAYASSAPAVEFVLSPRLVMDMGSPKGITHSGPAVLVYYDNRFLLSHEIVNPAKMYNGEPDVTGHLKCFIKKMFANDCDTPLPENLNKMSDIQAKALGIGIHKGKVVKYKVGNSDVFAVYNPKERIGFAYIFDGPITHNITSSESPEEFFFQSIKSIKTR